ncbi:hypothetical protein DFH27DRAFT_553091 [Peziza echinospora]|nr:hypothetical protein DFH27DRAFT_553091 [Peziza echinospora]
MSQQTNYDLQENTLPNMRRLPPRVPTPRPWAQGYEPSESAHNYTLSKVYDGEMPSRMVDMEGAMMEPRTEKIYRLAEATLRAKRAQVVVEEDILLFRDWKRLTQEAMAAKQIIPLPEAAIPRMTRYTSESYHTTSNVENTSFGNGNEYASFSEPASGLASGEAEYNKMDNTEHELANQLMNMNISKRKRTIKFADTPEFIPKSPRLTARNGVEKSRTKFPRSIYPSPHRRKEQRVKSQSARFNLNQMLNEGKHFEARLTDNEDGAESSTQTKGKTLSLEPMDADIADFF